MAGENARGKAEMAILKETIDDQLNRLMTQLEDLEELKDEFDDEEEYEETKAETLDQLKEFQLFLEKTLSGDLTLIDQFGSAQLAIQAAISEAFKTPEVIRMFANKQPDQLRKRLATLQREHKLQKLSKDSYNAQATEVLLALKRIGSELSSEEEAFLKSQSASNLLTSAGDSTLGTGMQSNLMSTASSQITKASRKGST